MKRLFIAALAAAALLTTPALAKDIKLPGDAPVITLTLPDDWSPKDIDNGVEASSPDKNVYLAFEATDAKDLPALMEDWGKYLMKEGVQLDMSTKKQSTGEVNGMKGVNFEFDGKDKDGPTRVDLTVLFPTKQKAVLITYWATPDAAQKNAAALGAIIKSVKPAS